MTFNIRRAIGEDSASSVRRVANVIAGQAPDLVGLNEVWRLPVIHDQPRGLSRWLEMEAVFQNNVQYGGLQRFGNLVLARPKVLREIDHKLPGGLQRRGLMVVEVESDGRRFAFGSTHLGLSRKARRAQIEAIAELIPTELPFVLVGDFNATDDAEFAPFLERLDMAPVLPTYSSVRPRKPLDRLFFSRDLKLERHFTVRTRSSDHLPLVADLRWRT